jgi:hypothetical protein
MKTISSIRKEIRKYKKYIPIQTTPLKLRPRNIAVNLGAPKNPNKKNTKTTKNII